VTLLAICVTAPGCESNVPLARPSQVHDCTAVDGLVLGLQFEYEELAPDTMHAMFGVCWFEKHAPGVLCQVPGQVREAPEGCADGLQWSGVSVALLELRQLTVAGCVFALVHDP